MSVTGFNETLQKLYNVGKAHQDEEIGFQDKNGTDYSSCESEKGDFSSAINIITTFEKDIGTEFGNYKEGLVKAITGMTRIEAFLFLQEVLNRLDTADGNKDSQIQTTDEKDMQYLFDKTGLGYAYAQKYGEPDRPEGTSVWATEGNLKEAAQHFKKDGNMDSEHINLLQDAQKPFFFRPTEKSPLYGAYQVRKEVIDEFNDNVPTVREILASHVKGVLNILKD
jgi:hypothetical protein